jgi:hypothetical protein
MTFKLNRLTKFIFILMFFLSVIGVFSKRLYALDGNCLPPEDGGGANFCQDLQNSAGSGEAPDPRGIVCLLVRIINVFVLVAGLALLYMILWGALKLTMSYGDPKGFMGAQNTWLYAFIGFLIVIGFFTAYVVLANTLGLPTPSPTGVQNALLEAIGGLLEAAEVNCANVATP